MQIMHPIVMKEEYTQVIQSKLEEDLFRVILDKKKRSVCQVGHVRVASKTYFAISYATLD